MVTILPADNETVARWKQEEQNAVADSGMLLRDRDVEIGHMLYAIQGDTLVLGDTVCADRTLTDGLLRAVVNIGWNHEIPLVRYDGEKDRAMLKVYGFSETDAGFSMTVQDFFKCGCKN